MANLRVSLRSRLAPRSGPVGRSIAKLSLLYRQWQRAAQSQIKMPQAFCYYNIRFLPFYNIVLRCMQYCLHRTLPQADCSMHKRRLRALLSTLLLWCRVIDFRQIVSLHRLKSFVEDRDSANVLEVMLGVTDSLNSVSTVAATHLIDFDDDQ